MRFLTILITTVALGIAAESAAPPPTAARKKATTTTAPVRLSAARSKAPVRSNTPAHKAAAPARQAGPTTDRYRQIQESLITKGYLQGSPTGVWDQNSVDAMKKFQNDQKLEPTGKITSKALINLGLGPTNESVPPPSK